MLRNRALQTHLRLQVAAIVCLTVVCGLIAAPACASTTQPTNPSLAELGRKIFFDVSLSASGQMACSSQPNSWTASQTASPDAFFEYVQYAYFRSTPTRTLPSVMRSGR